MLGTVGVRDRMDITVISDAVDLASRVESLTKTYRVPLIITEDDLSCPERSHRRFGSPHRPGPRPGKIAARRAYEVLDACDPRPDRRNCAHWRTSKRASRFTRPGTSQAPSAIRSEPGSQYIGHSCRGSARTCSPILRDGGRMIMNWKSAGVAAIIACSTGLMSAPAKAQANDAAKYVGVEICASYHRTQAERWKTSHHALAMEKATSATVLGDFSGISVENFGVVSTFSRVGDKFMVRTDGPGRSAARLRNHPYLRRRSAAAISDRISRRALPGAWAGLGHASKG